MNAAMIEGSRAYDAAEAMIERRAPRPLAPVLVAGAALLAWIWWCY